MRRTIKAITGENIKVPHFHHPLSPITVFYGENGRGKTARIDGIRLSFMGYHPERGNTAAATFSLCCGTRMASHLDISDGATIDRSWELKKDSIKSNTVLVPKDFPETPPVLLNAQLYLSKSETDRIKYIAGMKDLSDTKWTGERVCESIRTLQFDPPSQLVVEALLAVAGEFDASDMERNDQGMTVQDWLEARIIATKADLKAAKESADRLLKFVQAQSQLQSADTGSATRNVDAEIATCIQNLSQTKAKLATENDRFTQDDNKLKRKQELEDAILDIPAVSKSIAELSDSIQQQGRAVREYKSDVPAITEALAKAQKAEDEARATVKVLEGHLGRYNRYKAIQQRLQGMPDQTEQMGRLVKQAEGLHQQIASYQSDLAAAQSGGSSAQQHLQALEHNQKTLQSLLTSVMGKIEEGVKYKCPCCKQVGYDCESTKVRIKEDQESAGKISQDINKNGPEIEAAKKLLETQKQRFKDAQAADKQHDERQKQYRTLKDQIGAYDVKQQQINQLKAEQAGIGEIPADLEADIQKAKEALAAAELAKDEVNQKKVNAQEWDGAHEMRKEGLENCNIRLQELNTQLAALELNRAELAGMGDIKPADKVEVDRLSALIQEQEGKLATLQTMQKRHAAATQEQLRREQSKTDAERAQAKVIVLKAVEDKLIEVQGELVKEVFGGLLAIINKVTAGIINEPIEYHDGEIGRHKDGVWVKHKSFSESQKLVIMAGVSAALASDAPVRIIMIDNMENITPKRQAMLLTNMRRLIEDDIIDQFVGCVACEGDWSPPATFEIKSDISLIRV